MKNKLTLSIPKPCHEGWNNMQPSEQGRFCLSCQKQVVDFTGMTDAELFRFFVNKNKQEVCGRVLPEQLDTAIQQPVEHKKKRFWYLQYFSTLFMLMNKSDIKAQVKPAVVAVPADTPRYKLGEMVAMPVKQLRIVSGKVTDEKGGAIPFASVKIKGSKGGVSADANGLFKIKAMNDDILEVSGTGFKMKEVGLKEESLLTVSLEKYAGIVEGAIVFTKMSCSVDDAVGRDHPHCVANIIVRDSLAGKRIKAKISIEKYDGDKLRTVYTNRNGEYDLKKIKEDETYIITVSADGYQQRIEKINGDGFEKKRESRVINLQRSELAMAKIEKPMISKPVLSTQPEPKTILIATQPVKAINVDKRPQPNFLQKIGTIFQRPAITIYPNPVMSGTNATVQLNNFVNGDYQMIISNAAGQQLSNEQVRVVSKKQSAYIPSSSIKFPAVYVIALVNTSTNKTITTKLIVQ